MESGSLVHERFSQCVVGYGAVFVWIRLSLTTDVTPSLENHVTQRSIYNTERNSECVQFFFTPPRNRGGVIFSLQFVCVSVCLCVCVCVCLSVCLSVCPALLVNKIAAERMHRFGRGFRYMVAYNTGSDSVQRSRSQ